MKKIKVFDLFTNISLVIYILVILIQIYWKRILGNSGSIILLFIANLLLIFNIISKKKISLKNKYFIFLMLLLFLPSLYHNAYIQDHLYTYYMIYLLSIVYVILLSFIDIHNHSIKIIVNLLIIFSIITAIITWLSVLFPDFYVSKIIKLLPLSEQQRVTNDFLYNDMRMGLSNHYSRNAFFMILGLLGASYQYKNNAKKRYIILIGFLLVSLFIVGKRGHLIFLILSCMISYFIYNKVTKKTLLKFFIILLFIGVLTVVAIHVIPTAKYVFDRIFHNDGDISTGRFEIYSKAIELYKQHSGPIGWGQFSKSTEYFYVGVHNDYIQLFCEVGIIGLMMVLFNNIVFLKKAINLSHSKKDEFSFVILTYNLFFLLYSLTGIPHYDAEPYMIYFLFNSILFYLDRKEEKDEQTISKCYHSLL